MPGLEYRLGLRLWIVLQCRHHFRKREFGEGKKNINYYVRIFEDLKLIFPPQMRTKNQNWNLFAKQRSLTILSRHLSDFWKLFIWFVFFLVHFIYTCVCVSYILPGITLAFDIKSNFKFQTKRFQFVKAFCIDIFSVETKKQKIKYLGFFSPLIVTFWFGNVLSIVLCQTPLKTDQLICLLCNLHPHISENMQNTVNKNFVTFNRRNETWFVFLSSRWAFALPVRIHLQRV